MRRIWIDINFIYKDVFFGGYRTFWFLTKAVFLYGFYFLHKMNLEVTLAAMPRTCTEGPPFLIAQATAGGAIPGAPPYFTGPGINIAGPFSPSVVGPWVYSLKYTFVTNAGCLDSATQQLTVLQPSVADSRTVGVICLALAVNFESLSTTPAAQ